MPLELATRVPSVYGLTPLTPKTLTPKTLTPSFRIVDPES